MKKIILITIIALIISGCDKRILDNKNESNITNETNKTNETIMPNEVNEYISVTEARDIVLENANLSLDDIHDYEIELKTKDGVSLYEIEFETLTHSYEYSINATTGFIIEYSMDSENDRNDSSANDVVNNKGKDEKIEERINELEGINGISESSAIDIALNEANTNKDNLEFVKAYIVKYNGVFAYHVKFKTINHHTEYDYIVDIATGDIVFSEID